MKRREAIRNSTLFLGAISLSNGLLLQSCKPSLGDDWKPVFLSKMEAELLDEIAETILPRTDTPGAKDAKVMRYLDEYAHAFLESEEQELYKEGLNTFNEVSNKLVQKTFVEADEKQRAEILQYMYDDASLKPVFIQMRSAVNRGFFTSEQGATQVLEHVAIPGNYDGDIPYASTKGLVYSG